MGLGDLLRNMAEEAAKKQQQVEQRHIKQLALKQRMEAKSSCQLKEILKSEEGFFGVSREEKQMAHYVLRQRGEI